MDVKIEESWKKILSKEFEKPYFNHLTEFIIGQDPYHGAGQAHGLCFSVGEEVKSPPSLVNIFKELNADLNIPIPANGSLERWASQGVLLLNATLTVKAASPGSHQNKGWEEFTNAVIRALDKEKQQLVFILWGAYAQRKGEFIDRDKHLVIESAHPSPFAAHRGFFGSKPFSITNDYLKSVGKELIDW
jgi:uracil-DNA glycosylase